MVNRASSLTLANFLAGLRSKSFRLALPYLSNGKSLGAQTVGPTLFTWVVFTAGGDHQPLLEGHVRRKGWRPIKAPHWLGDIRGVHYDLRSGALNRSNARNLMKIHALSITPNRIMLTSQYIDD